VAVHGDIELSRMPTNKTASIDAAAAVDVVFKPGAGEKQTSVSNFAQIDESKNSSGKSLYVAASGSEVNAVQFDTEAARVTLTSPEGLGEASYRPEFGTWTTVDGTEEQPKRFISDETVRHYHVKATKDFAGKNPTPFALLSRHPWMRESHARSMTSLLAPPLHAQFSTSRRRPTS
jgi:hypothetical protein